MHMIQEFKARLFSDAMNLPMREIDTGDPLWVERIEAHFAVVGSLPPSGAPDEYAAAFEAAYPDEADRRTYIASKVESARPSYAHRLIGALVASGQTECMFSTNFDPLIETSVTVARDIAESSSKALTVATIDSAASASRCVAEGDWPLLVKLHGDFKSTRLKNIAAELQEQDASLRAAFFACCGRYGLVVVGYSGRDQSVMDVLGAALDGPTPFPGGIRWVARDPEDVLPAVSDFLSAADRAGVDVAVIPVATFDELAGAIERQAQLPPELGDHVKASRPTPLVVPVSHQRADGSQFPVLRCSALPVLELPRSARLLRVSSPMNAIEARQVVASSGVRNRVTVTARGGEVLAFGTDPDLLEAFAGHSPTVEGDVAIDPISDSVHLGLVYDGLLRAITSGRPLLPMLRSRGHGIRVRAPRADAPQVRRQQDLQALTALKSAYNGNLTGRIPGLGWDFGEAARVRLERFDDQWWCVYEPYTHIGWPRRTPETPTGATDDERSVANAWGKERWARRYNSAWAAVIDGWATTLVDGPTQDLAAHPQAAVGAAGAFTISRSTGWCRPASQGDRA